MSVAEPTPQTKQSLSAVFRRSVLAACATVVSAVWPKSSGGMTNSPILVLYRRWLSVRNQINGLESDQHTESLLYADLDEIECKIWLLPCKTAADLAAKFDVQTDCGGFYADDQFGDECKALLEHI